MKINPYLLKLSKKRSRQGLYEFLELQYQHIPQGASVLSVGSGGKVNELLEKYANTQGFEVQTIDIDSARKPDIIGDLCSYEFNDNSFDIVVMSEVLEHLHSPQLGLDNVYTSLKSGGKLILTVPFILPIHDAPHDYFRFTRYGLKLLLKKFNSVDILERNSYFESIDVLFLRLIVVKSKSAQLMSYLIIPIVYYLLRPITLLLSRLIPTNAITTGYNLTAIK